MSKYNAGPLAACRGATATAVGPGAVRQGTRGGRPPAPPWATAAAAAAAVGPGPSAVGPGGEGEGGGGKCYPR